jgi:hypothetical protein
MTPLHALWLPIVVAAVIVFVVSAIIHMTLPYHKGDFAKLPSEDGAMDALRPLNIPPGDYMVPCPASSEAMKSPEFIAKLTKGPVIVMTVIKPGPPNLSANLVQWFIYSLVIGVFVAYVSGRALPRGATYLQVFRFAGVTAFIAYAVAMWQDSIWYKRKWSTTIKNTFDGLIYGLMTAGTFGWLWPK